MMEKLRTHPLSTACIGRLQSLSDDQRGFGWCIAASVVGCIMFVFPALAQDTSTRYPLGGAWDIFVPYVIETVAVVIGVAIAWVSTMANKLMGVQLDAKSREALHSAAMTGVNAAVSKIGTLADTWTIDVKQQIIVEAIRWVERSVPDALKRLKVGPDEIAKIVASKLPVAEAVATAPVVAASPATT
jgi:hypothetical protein